MTNVRSVWKLETSTACIVHIRSVLSVAVPFSTWLFTWLEFTCDLFLYVNGFCVYDKVRQTFHAVSYSYSLYLGVVMLNFYFLSVRVFSVAPNRCVFPSVCTRLTVLVYARG